MAEAGDRWSFAPAGGWSPSLRKTRVYEQLLFDLITGELKPGERLDEASLVARYGAGLAGVRDALGRLALEGLVERRTRSGTRVSPLDPVEMDQTAVVREALEARAAALAAVHADQSEIDRLSMAFDGAEQAIAGEDHRALMLMDQAFHGAVATFSGNPVLAGKLASLQAVSARYWFLNMEGTSRADALAEVQNHRAVVCAIARRDPEAAETAMKRTLGPPSLPPRSQSAPPS